MATAVASLLIGALIAYISYKLLQLAFEFFSLLFNEIRQFFSDVPPIHFILGAIVLLIASFLLPQLKALKADPHSNIYHGVWRNT